MKWITEAMAENAERKHKEYIKSFNKNLLGDTIPRRARVDLWSPAERAINDAMAEVEKLPPDTGLTDAVILLQNAQRKVADYIDSVNDKR